MVVRQDVPALVDDDAGAEPGQLELLALAGAPRPEELVEEILVRRVIRERAGNDGWTPAPGDLDGADMYHGRPHVFSDAHECGLERLGRVRRLNRYRYARRGPRKEERMDPEACAEKGKKCTGDQGDADTSRHHQKRLETSISALAE